MAQTSSNREEIDALLDQLALGFNFTWHGIDGKGLGNELLDVYSEGIRDRTVVRQQEPAGGSLAPNAESYVNTPEKAGKPVGVLTGEMLSDLNLQGERTLEPDDAAMAFGAAGESFAKRKAQWFTCGSEAKDGLEPSGAENQPTRPFFDRDPTLDQAVLDRAQQQVDRFIDELTRGI